jgi:hypothetical protein
MHGLCGRAALCAGFLPSPASSCLPAASAGCMLCRALAHLGPPPPPSHLPSPPGMGPMPCDRCMREIAGGIVSKRAPGAARHLTVLQICVLVLVALTGGPSGSSQVRGGPPSPHPSSSRPREPQLSRMRLSNPLPAPPLAQGCCMRFLLSFCRLPYACGSSVLSMNGCLCYAAVRTVQMAQTRAWPWLRSRARSMSCRSSR